MDYQQTISYIESLIPRPVEPGLERFAAFMELHGNPQDNFLSFHVAGTNGKGSTVSMLDSVLTQLGLKCARYTGPHLLRWNERFQLAGNAISDTELAEVASELRERSEEFGRRHPLHGELTWFEFMTAIAFFYFARNQAEAGAIEVGLGGRWDATNILKHPVVTSIVTIGFDHMHMLGNTIAAIALEKSGIIKPNVPLVTAAGGDALSVILNRASENNAPAICVSLDNRERASVELISPRPQWHDLDSRILESFELVRQLLKYPGSYQALNALVATAAVVTGKSEMEILPRNNHQPAAGKLASIDSGELARGISSYYWPGRFQYIADRHMLLDGAHNGQGAEALRAALDQVYPNDKRCFVLGFFQNKDVASFVKTLLRPGDRVFAGAARVRRAVTPAQEICAVAAEQNCTAAPCGTIDQALAEAARQRQADELLIVAGSFESVKAAFRFLGVSDVAQLR